MRCTVTNAAAAPLFGLDVRRVVFQGGCAGPATSAELRRRSQAPVRSAWLRLPDLLHSDRVEPQDRKSGDEELTVLGRERHADRRPARRGIAWLRLAREQ